MNVLLVEPFYSGSHKFFADGLKKYSSHNITLLTLEGKYWKWRMYGGATTLGHQFLEMDLAPDVILVTDMLDLPVFLSTIRHKLDKHVPVYIYFHENQIAYPWKADSEDRAYKRDLHYGMMNYHSALAADKVLFNSDYNKNSFLEGLRAILNKMPDNKHMNYLEDLSQKCLTLHLGLELDKLTEMIPKSETAINAGSETTQPPLILWNHRWEHDKNPDTFFNALIHLKDENIPFRLAVLGENYQQAPAIFGQVETLFSNELIHFGYARYPEYIALLNQADILPVTSIHEFFGISVMEAVHYGATPLLPMRLSYPELYHPDENPEIFYNTNNELKEKLVLLCSDKSLRKNYCHITKAYAWHNMINFYDKLLNGHTSNT